MPQIAVVARVRVKEGRGDEYLAAFAPLLEQVDREPGTLLYVVQRSEDDSHVFWTSEIYADEAAFAAHSGSEVHAAAMPVFTELIAEADVIKGELVMGKGPVPSNCREDAEGSATKGERHAEADR